MPDLQCRSAADSFDVLVEGGKVEKVISKDGTPIAFDRVGSGPALILVDGAMCYRGFGPMAAMREPSRSPEADQLWNEGTVDVPRNGSSPRPQRGAFRAAVMTCAYFLKLISRG